MLLALLAGCGGNGNPEPSPVSQQPAPDRSSPASGTAPAASPIAATPSLPAPPKSPSESPIPAAPPPTAVPEPADGFPIPPERDLYRLARELIPGVSAVRRVEGAPAPALAAGDRQSFELVDLAKLERYSSEFELRLVTPNAYWFVEDGLKIELEDIERSAVEFEDATYPRITEAFGSEWKPGVDGDPRLYILNAALKGVGGYYSPEDEYPKEIRPASNEIEALYINVLYLPIGTPQYAQVLAHELQHAVHWNADPSEDSWVNEGLSELAVTIAGLPEYGRLAFQRSAPVSLTVWPPAVEDTGPNYGAASSFMHYLTEHYGGRANLRPLLSQQADSIDGINAFLEAGGHRARFEDVFRDWAVANLLDEDSGRYSHSGIGIPPPVFRTLRKDEEQESSIMQYATGYFRLASLQDSQARLSFSGDAATPLLPADVGEGCWWSNNGDSIDSTLTAPIDLRQSESATLTYQVWFAIEEDWDYVYVQVSENGGESWSVLETTLTSGADPLGVAFGPGYTGSSGGWRNDSVSLDEWAGREILLRFQYITDAAVHDHGLCLRGLAISGAGAAVLEELTTDGFVWNRNNSVRQEFIVQVVYAGEENRVLPLELDNRNRGAMTLATDSSTRYVAVSVQALAPSTRLPANYTLRLEPVE